MDTVTRPDVQLSVGAHRVLRLLTWWAVGLPIIAVAQTSTPSTAAGQGFHVEPSLRVTAVASDNVSFTSTDTRSDVVLVTTPALRLTGKGPEYELNGSISADALVYLGRTLADRLFPQGNLAGKVQVLPRLFFVDADASVKTTASDPFGPIGDGPTFLNRNKVARFSISPYIDRELSPLDRLTMRSSHAWSNGFGGDSAQLANDAYVETQAIRYERKPTPLGVRLTYDRQATEYTKEAGNNRIEIRTMRATALYAPNPELTLGAIAGTDQGEYTTNRISDTLTGGSLRWAPSQRTLLDTVVEKRFFGNGWNTTLTHRSPYVAFSGNIHRTVSTYASRQGLLGTTSDVSYLIDQMLITRIPDAAARAIAVQDIIAQRGLPASLGSPLEMYSGTVQVLQGSNVSLAWMGPRDTITAQYFVQRVRDLRDASEYVFLSADADQRGASLNYSHRLTASMAGDIGVTYSQVLGEGINLGRKTDNLLWRVGVSESLSPRTTASASLKRQLVTSDAPGYTANSVTVPASSTRIRSNALSIGVLHRF